MSTGTYTITTEALAARFARGESVAVLDVREPWERAHCALPLPESVVDVHIPLQQIPDKLDDLTASVGSRPLVVYCHHGVRSRMVADWLRAQRSWDVLNLEGGIDDWSRTIDPTVPRY